MKVYTRAWSVFVSLALSLAPAVGAHAVGPFRTDEAVRAPLTGALPQAVSAMSSDESAKPQAIGLDAENPADGVQSLKADLDTAGPTGSILINGGAWGTGNPRATLSMNAIDSSGKGVTGMRFSDDGAHWTLWAGFYPVVPHTLQGVDGYKTVRVQYRDSAGRVSQTYSDYILLDTTAPSGTVLINRGAFCTNRPEADLGLTWDDGPESAGVKYMRLSDDGAHWTVWEPVAPTVPHTLPGPDGHKTVRVQFKDALGNASYSVTDYILLDRTKPTGTISINGGASTTSSPKVTLSLSWSDGAGGSGVSMMRFSDDGATWTAWERVAATKARTLPGTNGYKTVRVQFSDVAGNYSDVFNDYILLNAK